MKDKILNINNKKSKADSMMDLIIRGKQMNDAFMKFDSINKKNSKKKAKIGYTYIVFFILLTACVIYKSPLIVYLLLGGIPAIMIKELFFTDKVLFDKVKNNEIIEINKEESENANYYFEKFRKAFARESDEYLSDEYKEDYEMYHEEVEEELEKPEGIVIPFPNSSISDNKNQINDINNNVISLFSQKPLVNEESKDNEASIISFEDATRKTKDEVINNAMGRFATYCYMYNVGASCVTEKEWNAFFNTIYNKLEEKGIEDKYDSIIDSLITEIISNSVAYHENIKFSDLLKSLKILKHSDITTEDIKHIISEIHEELDSKKLIFIKNFDK